LYKQRRKAQLHLSLVKVKSSAKRFMVLPSGNSYDPNAESLYNGDSVRTWSSTRAE
jgi:hypothetical protein